MKNLVYDITMMQGFGDTIYQRPHIRSIARIAQTVYVRTSWPQLFADLLNVYPVLPRTELRTQSENVRSFKNWHDPHSAAKKVTLWYGPRELTENESINRALENQLNLHGPLVMDVPGRVAKPPIIGRPVDRPLAIVRPVTVRSEWVNVARNPRPEYVAELSRELMKTHYVVSLAYTVKDEEWILDPEPPAHVKINHGQLSTLECLEICRQADIIVGGVGWIVPAGLALRVPTFSVLGGQGAYNAPNKIVDTRLKANWMGFAKPEKFCTCNDRLHVCDKVIPDLLEQFNSWRTSL